MKLRLNPLQFAIVREDYLPEEYLIKKYPVKKMLIVGSGGCSLLNLSLLNPKINYTILEPNPVQIELIKKKMSTSDVKNFQKLCQKGNFESLFRQLKSFWNEFILAEDEWKKLLQLPLKERRKKLALIFKNKYWTTSFELFFHDSILLSMFGPMAIQHAPKGSYPKYFQKKIEHGLERDDADTNYFLHHILFGEFLKQSLPPYFLEKNKARFVFIQKTLQQMSHFHTYDLLQVSNIFDWMPESDIKNVAKKIDKNCKKGAVIFWRQLNNQRNFEEYFTSFSFQAIMAKKLLTKDRSLFYDSFHIGVRK
jgi:S-adenosylmethionine-diacylglycerol 3-amino-3-carboxypropyl transferase